MASPGGSTDEGEIVENGVGDLKATTLPDPERSGVDRQDRNRGRRSPSPGSDRYGGSASRRPPSPRGFKRSRDDRDDPQYHGSGSSGRGGGADHRKFRVHYEDRPPPRDDRRSRHHYEDLDRPASRGSSRRQDDAGRSAPRGSDRHDRDYGGRAHHDDYYDRDRHPDSKRPRTRSRSPPPQHRGGRGRRDRDRRGADRFDRRQHQAESSPGYSAHQQPPNDRRPRDDTASKRAPADRAATDASRGIAKFHQVAAASRGSAESRGAAGQSNGDAPQASHAQESREDATQDWEEAPKIDEEEEIRRRRQRREELLRKSRASTPMHLLSLQADRTATSTPGDSTQATTTPQLTQANTPHSAAATPPMSPAGVSQDVMSREAFDLANDQDLINTHGKKDVAAGGSDEEDGPSAANYDPTVDMQEDERRDELRHGAVGLHGEERRGSLVATTTADQPEAQESESQPEKPAESGGGGGGEDDFDMFAEDFDEEKYVAPKGAAPKAVDAAAVAAELAQPNGGGILEGDDKDGYYKLRPGEIMNGRYQVQSTLGKGMFSGVVRAVDITNKKLVAIKIMRNNDALRKGGFTEIAILQKLNAADPENKKHIVKFERSFEHKGHLCMAFENLSLNLREVLKKFGNNVGINLKGVRVYAYQIFVALAHLRKCSIIHADLKPDNILVNENRSVLKICDLGTAIDRSDAATSHNEITPYLVSRFYRAPEIILGIPYDYAADMWSIGCTLYEMYTGKILFAGDSNNQMLRAMMEIRGKIGNKLYRRGELWRLHFDDLGNFVSQERDKVLGKATVRTIAMIKPTRDLRTRLMAASSGMDDAETKELNLFHDLLDRCLALNPDKRITAIEALKHPFFTSRVHSSSGR